MELFVEFETMLGKEGQIVVDRPTSASERLSAGTFEGFASNRSGLLAERCPGRLSIGVVRISLFAAILTVYVRFLLNVGDVEGWYQRVSLSGYQPKGLVQVFWSAPPPVWLVEAMIVVAGLSTIFAVAGFLTRPAMVISVVTVLFLQSLTYSFRFGWSHTYNVIFLAGLAFMFGRAGDVLSVDALMRRSRSIDSATMQAGNRYLWPILLGQAMIALFYFGACFAKVAGDDNRFNLDWVFSDSLRNMIIQPWFVADQPLPWLVELFASHQLLWQLAALGHLAIQFSPILACVFINNPMVRLVEGIVFAIGVILLGAFMGYWNLDWLLLVPFFVDWDYFFSARRISNNLPQARLKVRHTIRNSLVYAWSAFLVLSITATFVFRLGFVHFFYPFSNLDFFSNINAEQPLSEHRPWHQDIGEISIVTGDGEIFIQPDNLALISRYRGIDKLRIDESIDQKRGLVLAAANEELGRQQWKSLGDHVAVSPSKDSINEIRFWGAIVRFPAYPARPGWKVIFRGLLGIYDVETGVVQVAHGHLLPKGTNGEVERIDLSLSGFRSPRIRLFWIPNPRQATGHPVPLEFQGRFDDRETAARSNELAVRFVPSPGQLLPWGAATLIEVREDGSSESWRFIGPNAVW